MPSQHLPLYSYYTHLSFLFYFSHFPPQFLTLSVDEMQKNCELMCAQPKLLKKVLLIRHTNKLCMHNIYNAHRDTLYAADVWHVIKA